MRLIDFQSLCFDAGRLIKNNRVKFFLLLALAACAVVAGAGRGIFLLRTAHVIKIDSLNIVLLIKESKGLFGYLLTAFFGCAVFTFFVLLCSYRFSTTFISAAFFFVITFTSAKNLVLLFGVLRLAFLPSGIVCFIVLLTKTAVFLMLILYTMDRYFDRFCRISNIMSDIIPIYIAVLIPVLVLCVIESVLVSLFTATLTF